MSTERIRIVPGDGNPRHGTSNGYDYLRCRCDICRDGNTARKGAEQKRRRGRLSPDDSRHGTINGYVHYGCRCLECMAANRTYSAAHRPARTPRAERPNLPPDDPRHGTATAYGYHGCRCKVCRSAASQRVREYRGSSKTTGAEGSQRKRWENLV